MKEIEAVHKKYDTGGMTILCDGMGHSEYRLFIDTPEWSTIRFLKNKPGIHFKAYTKSMKFETGATVNMIFVLLDTLGNCYLMVEQIRDLMKKNMEIEVGDSVFKPHEE